MSTYRIIGAEESPYSVKVRSYLTYKQLPFEWLHRNEANLLYQQHAKLPLIPLLVGPDDQALQDSTPMIEQLERAHPEPSIYPQDPVCRFIDLLLEEFADEWGNKWMFHYRWARPADQIACAERLAQGMQPQASERELQELAQTIRERMVDRVWFVGSSPQTAPQIESSLKDMLELLNAHLSDRLYLFGAQPAFADFALWGQLYNCYRDPTPHELIRIRAPNVVRWIERMSAPAAEGPFESWFSLEPGLAPILKDQVAGLFLPWSRANAQAIDQQQESFEVRLNSGVWQQRAQKYHARSLQTLIGKYHQHREPALDAVLDECQCLSYLSG